LNCVASASTAARRPVVIAKPTALIQARTCAGEEHRELAADDEVGLPLGVGKSPVSDDAFAVRPIRPRLIWSRRQIVLAPHPRIIASRARHAYIALG